MTYKIISKNDANGFWALFADNLANIVILSTICKYVFKMPDSIVFGRILPGLGISLIIGLSIYAYMAIRLAKKENREDVTALPYGISTPVMFVYLFGVIGPVYWKTGNSTIAWQVGVAAAFIGGIVEASGSIFGPFLKKHTPRAGMLGTLAGIAIVWIATVPMAEIMEHPLIGFPSFIIILLGLVAYVKMPFKLPAGLLAIIVGTIIGFFTKDSKLILDGFKFYPPLLVLNDLKAGLIYIFKNPFIFSVVLPIEIYNFIETMNNVESASAAGDKYDVKKCQIFDGIGTISGAIFGSSFPTTVYIGHPAYKKLGSRAGYALLVGIVFFIGNIFGLIDFLHNLIPIAAVAPMLVFIGLVITAQAFNASPSQHSFAVAIAILPHISNIIVTKLNNFAGLLNVKIDQTLIQKMTVEQGIHYSGHYLLSAGAILVGLFWGAILAFIIDKNFKKASYYSFAAAFLTMIGIIHSTNISLNFSQIFFGYIICAIVFGFLSFNSNTLKN